MNNLKLDLWSSGGCGGEFKLITSVTYAPKAPALGRPWALNGLLGTLKKLSKLSNFCDMVDVHAAHPYDMISDLEYKQDV